jgi:hypothetical protein
MARVGLELIFRRKLFWALYALGLMLFLLFFFGQYLLAWAETQSAEQTVSIGLVRVDPHWLVTKLRDSLKMNGSGDTYRNFFWYQGWMVMVILALAGSVLVGNDFRFGTLPFYLAKPLRPRHYLLGKCLAVAVFVNLMTTVPALVLFVQYAFLYQWDYFVGQGWTPFEGVRLPVNALLVGILGYGLVLTVSLSLTLVAAASWLRRTVPLVMVWTTLFFFLRLLGAALVDGLHYSPRWRLIDLWNSTYLLGNWCLGMPLSSIRPAAQPEYHEAALVVGALCLLCLTHLLLRIRAVEIVR